MAEPAVDAAGCSELLDDVVQALFGAGLRLEACLHIIEADSANLRGELDTAIDGLHELIAKIRHHLHGH